MEVHTRIWTIKTLVARRDSIEHQPLYQRGEVWTLDKRQLLLDSVLRQFDFPKIYLRKLSHNSLYSHQIVDGQQRLTSIWRYTGDGSESFPLHKGKDVPKAWTGKRFSELRKDYRERILSFPVVIAEIEDASDDEVRELFARLQKGMQLNSAELRNSIRSEIGREIRAIALNHPYFPSSPFSSKRYKHHDLAAHAFAMELYADSRDIKAPDLRQMYYDYSTKSKAGLVEAVNSHLNYLHEMQIAVPSVINRKWGFVDVYSVVSRNKTSRPSAATLAAKYRGFEEERLSHTAKPEDLLDTGKKRDEEMYNYIMAFKLSAGEQKQLGTRYSVIRKRLI